MKLYQRHEIDLSEKDGRCPLCGAGGAELEKCKRFEIDPQTYEYRTLPIYVCPQCAKEINTSPLTEFDKFAQKFSKDELPNYHDFIELIVESSMSGEEKLLLDMMYLRKLFPRSQAKREESQDSE